MNTIITIPRTLANRLLTLAQQSPEAEVCGLISASQDNKYRLFPIENISEAKDCVFEMAPQQQIAAFREIREAGDDLFAIFHSHPHSVATPSPKDLEDANYRDALNIIISLDTQGVLDMRAFYYRGDSGDQAVENVDLVID